MLNWVFYYLTFATYTKYKTRKNVGHKEKKNRVSCEITHK